MDYEQKILEENPYNWKKHAIYQIPEVLAFWLKIFIVFKLVQIMTAVMFTTVACQALIK